MWIFDCMRVIYSVQERTVQFYLHYKTINEQLIDKQADKSFPGGSVIKNHLPIRRCGFDPRVRKIPWRRKWQPIPVFLSRKFHGQRSLEGYSLWGCKELDTTDPVLKQQDPMVYLCYIQQYVHVNLKLLILSYPPFPFGNCKFVFYVCESHSVL